MPGGISVTIKDLNDAGMVVPKIPAFDSAIWPVEKMNGSWRTMT